MQSRIEEIREKKLIGMSLEMTFANNKSAELWRGFMPRKNEVINRVDGRHYSLQQYSGQNNPMTHGYDKPYTKWALAEVTNQDIIPDGMQAYTLSAGKYMVFKYKGTPMEAMPFINNIFTKWIPESEYELDARPHFEILPEGYNPMSEDAEEEFWIAIK